MMAPFGGSFGVVGEPPLQPAIPRTLADRPATNPITDATRFIRGEPPSMELYREVRNGNCFREASALVGCVLEMDRA